MGYAQYKLTVTNEYLQEFTMAVRGKRRGDAEEVVLVMKRRCIMVVVKRDRSEKEQE